MAEPARPNTDRVEKLTYSVSDLLQQVALLQEELRVVVARAEGEHGSLRQATCIFEEVTQRAAERQGALEGRVAELEALHAPEQWRGALKKAEERLTILEFDREAAAKASVRHEAGARALGQRLDELEETLRQEARARPSTEEALQKLSVQTLELECLVLKSDSELKATVATNTQQAQECSEGIAGLKLKLVETTEDIAGLRRSLVDTSEDVAGLKHGLVETCEDIAGVKRSLLDASEQARVFQVDVQDLRCLIGESTEKADPLEGLEVLRSSALQTSQRSLAACRRQGVQSSLAVQHRIDELKLVVSENTERSRACLRDIEGLKLALGESSKTSTSCQRHLEEVHANLRRQEVLSQSLGARSTALERALRQCAADLKAAVLLSYQRGRETQQNLSDLRLPVLDGQSRLQDLEQSLERLSQQEMQSQRDVQELRDALRPRDPRQWNECQLAHWLTRRGLPTEVAQALEAHLVNGIVGPDLAEEDLATMGIVDSLLQRRVLCELRGLFAASDAKPALAQPHETMALARTLAPRVLRPQSARVGNVGGGLQGLRKHGGVRAPSSQRRRSPQEAAALALSGGLRMPLGRRCVQEAQAEEPLASPAVELEKGEEKNCIARSEVPCLGDLRGEVLRKLEDFARRLENSDLWT